MNDLWLYLALAFVMGAASVCFLWLLQLRRHAHAAAITAAQYQTETALLQQQLTLTQEEMATTKIIAAEQVRRLDVVRDDNRRLASDLATQTAYARRASELEETIRLWQGKHAEIQEKWHNARISAEKMAVQIQEEREAAAEKLQLVSEARETLSLQFKTLANQILEEKTRIFTEQNQQGINRLIAPVHEKMQEFSKLVQETYAKDSSERGVLRHELQRLQQLNTQLNDEAKSLTLALTGSNNKTQGMWGEMILEKILEHSGLRRDTEYIVQAALTRREEEGNEQIRPDAVVLLPEKRYIVIDAKVSLKAYVDYANAENDAARTEALTKHIASVRRHIQELSAKRYQDLPQDGVLDFVLMFIPVEPAYLLALQKDEGLLVDAFDRHIMPVGPGTLLAVLRTITGVWRYENQNRNALAIAQAGGKLHDKFVTLFNTLEKLGNQLDTAAKTHHDAMKQLYEGRGNLIAKVRNLQEMGAKTAKKLPDNYIDDETEGDVPIMEE